MKCLKSFIILLSLSLGVVSCQQKEAKVEIQATSTGFPFKLPKEKPNRPLSESLERTYDNYLATRPEDNELYSQFRYTELKGFDYNNHDGTITRRDPSKVIFANGKYYA